MRAIIQRVTKASVIIEGKEFSKIERGLLIYIGISHEDTENEVIKLANKISNLRIFSCELDRLNKSIQDIEGEILVVSQFTLYGDIKRGNRPSFTKAALPDKALELYEKFIEELKEKYVVKSGIFGANMAINSVNDGPVTIIYDSVENCDD